MSLLSSIGGIVDNTLGTSIFGENANDKALSAQRGATGQANATLNQALNSQLTTLEPWQQGGQNAFNQLAGNSFMDNWQQDPGYQFRLQQGQQGINNAMAARGMGNSGAALKALAGYNQNMASQEYGNVYNREASRLGALAGMGQDAANNIASAHGSWGANTSNNHMGLGNAAAAAHIGKANQTGALVDNLFSLAGSKKSDALFSDLRLKTNVKPVSKDLLDELRKELKAFYYDYKDKLHGAGRYIGIMAQDLEKTKLGKEIVVEIDGKKVIDVHRLLSVFLATLAEGEAA